MLLISFLFRFFQKIVDAGDPSVEFIVEYSNETFGYKKHGYIVKFKTKFSHILNATASKALVLEGIGGDDDLKYYVGTDMPEVEEEEEVSTSNYHYTLQYSSITSTNNLNIRGLILN